MKFLLLAALLGYASTNLKCPPDKVLNSCGDLCQVTCKDVTTHNVPKACPEVCLPPACVCPEGQALIRGQCVAYGHCWRLPPEEDPASKQLECPAGKVLDPCGDLCQVTCQDVITNNIPKPCPKICLEPKCVCPNGTALYHRSRTCVPYGNCWRLPHDTPHADTQRIQLENQQKIITTSNGHNGSSSLSESHEESNDQSKINQQQNIVTAKLCGPTEQLSFCGQRCDKPCSIMQFVPFCANPPCKLLECSCKDGYNRDGNGECVPEDACPHMNNNPSIQLQNNRKIIKSSNGQGRSSSSSSENSQESKDQSKIHQQPKNIPLKVCGPNEEYSLCGRRCEKNCINLYVLRPFCASNPCLFGDCTCKEGYARNLQGTCVQPTQCPNYENTQQIQLENSRKVIKSPNGQGRSSSSSSESSQESNDQSKIHLQQKNTPLNSCGPNEEYAPCGRQCEKSCLFLYAFDPFCPRGACIVGDCTCKRGYARNEQGSCVPPSQCPNLKSIKAIER